MGDRRQINFNNKLWYYTHWGGYALPFDLQNSIKFSKDRWGDDSYCLRIIISQLTKDITNQTTGAGLWFEYLDSEYNDFEVDITNQKVKLNNETWTFEEFINLSDEELKSMSK